MDSAASTVSRYQRRSSIWLPKSTSRVEIDPETPSIAAQCLSGSTQELASGRSSPLSTPAIQAAPRFATKRHSMFVESPAKRRPPCSGATDGEDNFSRQPELYHESHKLKGKRRELPNSSLSPPTPCPHIDLRKKLILSRHHKTPLRRPTSKYAPLTPVSMASGSKNASSSSRMFTSDSPSSSVTTPNSSAAENAGSLARRVLNLDYSDIHQAMTTDDLIEIKSQTVNVRSGILDLRAAARDPTTSKTLRLCEEVVLDRLRCLDAIFAAQKAAGPPTPMSSPPTINPSAAPGTSSRPRVLQALAAPITSHYRPSNDAHESVYDPSLASARIGLEEESVSGEPTTNTNFHRTDMHDISSPNSRSIEAHNSDGSDELWDQLGSFDFSPESDLAPASRPKATRATTSPRVLVSAPPAQHHAKGKNTNLGLTGEAPPLTNFLRTLEGVFGLHSFRENQLEACTASVEGRDIIVVMPTGGGKSLCFELPAVMKNADMGGVTVVISPLVALMQDQAFALREKGVKVARFYAGQTSEEADSVHRLLRTPGRRPALLYVSPEKLTQSEKLRADLAMLYEAGLFVRLVVDEAHCIITWGAFRESYEMLSWTRDEYPDVPVIALTAAVNQQTLDNIITRLRMRNCVRLRAKSNNRPNLRYEVLHKGGSNTEIAAMIKEQYPGETGIIYCSSRAKCEKLAKYLRSSDILAGHYHAEAGNFHKESVHKDWLKGYVKVMVATTAFGMGINKPDVRFVIHTAMPHSLENYYQETGRAGRDGKPSDCILYYHWADAAYKMVHRQQNAEATRRSSQHAEYASEDARCIVQYCLNNIDCRRKQLLSHFDEHFDQQDCHKSCDNCQRRVLIRPIDLSEHAVRLVTLAQCAEKANIRPSRGPLLDAFTGTQMYRSAYYVKLRALSVSIGAPIGAESRSSLERLHDVLIARGILATSSESSKSSWHKNYTHPGDAAIEFLQKPVPIIFGLPRTGGHKMQMGEQDS